ncbi:MAG: hypothetical protein VYE27_05455 [Pseudomonadota bacterium]|nr:hypothetical protein [Pseudomonadota bacterium]
MKTFSLKFIFLALFLSSAIVTNSMELKEPLITKKSQIEDLLNELQKARSSNEATKLRRKIWQEWMNGYQSERVREKLGHAMSFFYDNQLEAAEKIFDEIITLEPDFVEAWNKRATVRYLRDNLSGSLHDINQVLERQSRHFGAISGSGLIYLKLGEPKKALESYLLVSQIDPWNEEAKKITLQLKDLLHGVTL